MADGFNTMDSCRGTAKLNSYEQDSKPVQPFALFVFLSAFARKSGSRKGAKEYLRRKGLSQILDEFSPVDNPWEG
jgi:hypothetical protein